MNNGKIIEWKNCWNKIYGKVAEKVWLQVKPKIGDNIITNVPKALIKNLKDWRRNCLCLKNLKGIYHGNGN